MKNLVTEKADETNDSEESKVENFTPIFLLKSQSNRNISGEKHKAMITAEPETDKDLKNWCSIL